MDSVDPLENSASGIIGCLRMLATEAEKLHLNLTLAAIEQAVTACHSEAIGCSTARFLN